MNINHLSKQHDRRSFPLVCFPEDIACFINRVSPNTLSKIDRNELRILVSLGTKFEPIMQITPATPIPYHIGFETLGIGALGENFNQICSELKTIDPGLIRIVLCLVAFNTIRTLRWQASSTGLHSARHLIFTTNLDPELLCSPYIEELLESYRDVYEGGKFLFEISERTSLKCLKKLKQLHIDFKLRFCADDYNNWTTEVKNALTDQVEITKIDAEHFSHIIQQRGDDPEYVLQTISKNQIEGKSLIIEGIEDMNHLRFLEQHWPHNKSEPLYGQGYIIPPSPPWDQWFYDLKSSGLPGGHILNSESCTVSTNNIGG